MGAVRGVDLSGCGAKMIVIGIVGACGGTTGLAVGWDYQDMDGDGIRNGIDADVDGDGVANQHDIYPLNPYYW